MSDTLWTKIDRVAEAAGYKYGTRNKWKQRGEVPASNHFPLVETAKKIGVKLTYKELNTIQ